MSHPSSGIEGYRVQIALLLLLFETLNAAVPAGHSVCCK